MGAIDELLTKFKTLPPDRQAELTRLAERTSGLIWVPNAGPQTLAYTSQADELLYGGEAGGGKTDLLCGTALTSHRRSLILRRINKDATKIVDRLSEIIGTRDGYNGQAQTYRDGPVQIDFGGCEFEDDKQRYKGFPHDFIGFDELVDFTQSQYQFIIGWNRSSIQGQRCRVIAATNPPTSAEGLWVLKRWGAWLDPLHPKPARVGELRWYLTINGEDTEVDGAGPHIVDGRPEIARSRTFIPASLDDNPDLSRTGYSAVLASLPEELRRAYKEGDWSVGQRDHEWQVIPTRWIELAQARWQPDGWKQFAMTCMSVDPAGGGVDAEEIIWRHGGWFAEPITTKGEETNDGAACAGRVFRYRRDTCPVVVDSGGGYGGAVALRLKDNGVAIRPYNGASASTQKTRDAAKLSFFNKRAEAVWRLREALDPDQEGGSVVALPPSAEIKSDLASYRWTLERNGIKIEDKKKMKERLGRSPGKGDAIIMCLSEGEAAARKQQRDAKTGSLPTMANRGYDKQKRMMQS